MKRTLKDELLMPLGSKPQIDDATRNTRSDLGQ